LEANDFILDKFIWAVDELFHLGFPYRSVTLERSTGEPDGKAFNLVENVGFECV